MKRRPCLGRRPAGDVGDGGDGETSFTLLLRLFLCSHFQIFLYLLGSKVVARKCTKPSETALYGNLFRLS